MFLWNGNAKIVKYHTWGKAIVKKWNTTFTCRVFLKKNWWQKRTFYHWNFLQPDPYESFTVVAHGISRLSRYKKICNCLALICDCPAATLLKHNSSRYEEFHERFLIFTTFVYLFNSAISIICWLFWIRVIITNDFPK